jgi:hypothetical protein
MKFLESLTTLVNALTPTKLGLAAASVFVGVTGYAGYLAAPVLVHKLVPQESMSKDNSLVANDASRMLISKFMAQHIDSIAYLTMLEFDFINNLRVPVYRSFNNSGLERVINERNGSGNGALPIFLANAQTNNLQMVSVLRGEAICEPYLSGGLGIKWPDLANLMHTSCRVPVPPAFGRGIRGYFVAHTSRELSKYELEAFGVEMLALAAAIDAAQ